jgi:hypothetical protein
MAANNLGLTLTYKPDPDRLPIEEAYEDSQILEDELTVFGEPVNVGTEEDVRKGPDFTRDKGIRSPLESTSEQVRDLATRLQDPSIRRTLNAFLGTVTGGVIDLDSVDAHLKETMAGAQPDQTALAKKLSTLEGLKLLDPVGNTAEAVAREQAIRDGLSPELADKVASTVGLLSMALPGGAVKKGGAKLGNEIFLNSLFSNPRSHIVNVTSNMLMSAWSVPVRLFAATASAVEYGVTLGSHPRQVFFGESAAMLFGMLTSLTDAVRAAGKSLRTGAEAFGPGKFSETADALKVGDTGVAGGVRYRVKEVKETLVDHGVGWWGHIWRSPTRALQAEDAFAKTFNYGAELYAQAYREAMFARKAGVLDAAGETTKFLDDMRRFATSPSGEVKLRAQQHALKYTFNRELNELGPWLETLAKAGQGLSSLSVWEIPVGRIVVPIVRTPTNMVHYTLESTPVLNLLSSTFRADVRAGGATRALALGQAGAGSMLGAAVAYYAHSGLITGGGPVDATERKNLTELTGWQYDSIRIGDTYYSYEGLAPLGPMISFWSNFAEFGAQLDEHKKTEVIWAGLFATSRNLTSKLYVEQAADLFEAMAGDEAALARLKKAGLRTLVPGVARLAKKVTDPAVRDPESPSVAETESAWSEALGILNQYKAEIPGFSTSLPPRRNLWGDVITVPSGWLIGQLSPVYTTTAKNDPAGDEIVRLRLPVGRAPRVILGKDPESHPPDRNPSPLDTGIELTDAEYDEFVRLAGNELKVNGQGLHDKLNEVVTSDERYLKANDLIRGGVITNIVNAYRRAAIGELLKNNEAILEAYKESVSQKGRALGAPRPAQQLPTTLPR